MEISNAYQTSLSSGSSSGSAVPASKNVAVQSSTLKNDPVSTGNDTSRYQSGAAQKLQRALSDLDLPELADGNSRVELNFNQDTGRVIARVTDRISGEILREIPSKELQQLFAHMREYLGSVVDEEI